MTEEDKKIGALLLADNVAHHDVLLQHILSCLFESKTFSEFKTKVSKDIETITFDDSVTTDKNVLKEKQGYTITVESINFETGVRGEKRDYLRDDDGKPTVYKTFDEAAKQASLLIGSKPEINEI